MQKVENIWDEFSTPEKAQRLLQLVSFRKFKDTAEATENAKSIADGKIAKALKKILKKELKEREELAVGDVRLGNMIKEKFNAVCVHNKMTDMIMRGIRTHVDSLLGEYNQDLRDMNLAVAHSLSRYRV
ncbi:unnamed protein product [Gongylonema pulchrum]|uniref:Nucleolar protein 58/56 N-terminal domain-containing protein n=1 Tax=Gongylonema pulchrum TaxID=637853 RepID=A0A3P6PPQ2_9BILA|nr:unnamed protein product [Gongylonema pulchrum]